MKPNALLIASLATTTTAIGMKPSPTPDKPATFRWKYPFSDEAMASWSPACTATKAFDAREYTLHDLTAPFPKGLGDWEEGLREFFGGREYPGGWGGWDKHLHDRSIVTMEWADVPARVKAWIAEQEEGEGEGKGLFAVFDKKKGDEGAEGAESGGGEAAADSAVDKTGDGGKVVIFAPGALYEVLPLWVADGSECEDALLDLSRYQPTHADGAVVAWPKKTSPRKKAISIEVTASLLAPKEVEGSPVEGEVEESGEQPADAEAAAETGKGKDEL